MDCLQLGIWPSKNLTLLSHTTNSILYELPNVQILKNFTNKIALDLGTFQREICALQRLERFEWAPKLVCVGNNYIVMTDKGRKRYADDLPSNYNNQVHRIIQNMKSIGLRHNDMLKIEDTDIVIDKNDSVSLVDFGWASFDGFLNVTCTFGKHIFTAPNKRHYNRMLNRGFNNRDETKHTIVRRPLPNFVSYGDPRNKRNIGSQSETPTVKFTDSVAKIGGYQQFDILKKDGIIQFHSQPRKYSYIQHKLNQLYNINGCKTFTDIGCNAGLNSFIAAEIGYHQVYSLDHDNQYIDTLSQIVKWKEKESTIIPKVFNFGERLPTVDVALCGALIHWVFCRTANFQNSFDRIFQYLFASVNKFLLIEWVNTNDPAVITMRNSAWWPDRCFQNASRKRPPYNLEAFVRALKKHAKIIETHAPQSSTRVFYLLQKNDPFLQNP